MRQGEVFAVKYRLTKRLGRGGMAEVWRAEHISTGRQFAIKVMHEHAAENRESRDRFTREARLSARIRHPGIVDVIDVGQLESGVPYLVIELLDGLALGEVLESDPPISIRDLLTVLAETARAIAAAHAQGVVHRDLKPANIFLHLDPSTGFHRAKVVDFGIGKMSLPDDSFDTATHDVLGSPRFMSPEQATSAAGTDHRTDIWALGVVLFVALTAQWPHDGDHFGSLVLNITKHPPKRIEQFAPGLPDDLYALVHDMLAPKGERLSSAVALADRLDRLLSHHDLSDLQAKWAPRGAGMSRRRIDREFRFETTAPTSVDDADTDAELDTFAELDAMAAATTQPELEGDLDTLVDDPLAGEAPTTKMRSPAKPADVAWNPVSLGTRRPDALSGRIDELPPIPGQTDSPTDPELDEEQDLETIQLRRRPPPVPPLPSLATPRRTRLARDPRILPLAAAAALMVFAVTVAYFMR